MTTTSVKIKASNPISAFIITQNAEKTLATTLISIKPIVNEIIIIDLNSIDATKSIATSFGCKIFNYNKLDYTSQECFAAKLATNKWLLNIEQNYQISQDLQDEINYIFQAKIQEQYQGYSAKIISIITGKQRFLAPRIDKLILYNKQHIKHIINHNINSMHLLNLLSPIHQTFLDSTQQLKNKINYYDSKHKTKNFNIKYAVLLPIIGIKYTYYFLMTYLIDRYFIFGFQGFIYARLFAYQTTYKINDPA